MITKTGDDDRPQWIVMCDARGCITEPIVTITDTQLASILRGLSWFVAQDGVHCWCPIHAKSAEKMP